MQVRVGIIVEDCMQDMGLYHSCMQVHVGTIVEDHMQDMGLYY